MLSLDFKLYDVVHIICFLELTAEIKVNTWTFRGYFDEYLDLFREKPGVQACVYKH